MRWNGVLEEGKKRCIMTGRRDLGGVMNLDENLEERHLPYLAL